MIKVLLTDMLQQQKKGGEKIYGSWILSIGFNRFHHHEITMENLKNQLLKQILLQMGFRELGEICHVACYLKTNLCNQRLVDSN